MKTCTRCKEDLSESQFYKDGRVIDGLRSWCKICHQEVSLRYQKNDPQGGQRRGREYRDRHPFRLDVQRAHRRAAKFGVESTLTESEWKDCVTESNFECHICGIGLTITVKQNNTLSLDHLVPLNRGGKNIKGNVGPACWNCNRSKGDRTQDEFRIWINRVVENNERGT